MDPTFDTVADDMPRQFFGLQRRPKLIHSVGCIAQAKWVPTDRNPYTGVFNGCDNLFIRFSLAKEATKGAKGYAPGISVKCMRSGVPSANIFAMFSLQGQDSWNFFKHDLTNHVPDLSSKADFILQRLRGKFAEASDWPTMLGLADFATYDQNGGNVTEPKFPFRLIFHPTTVVHNSFDDAPTDDPFENVIAKKLSPGPLYYVYAQDQPTDLPSQYIQIGVLSLTAKPGTSQFSDKFMFYQHSRMEDDFDYYPQWVAHAKEIVQQQRNTDYYTYPDLPFS